MSHPIERRGNLEIEWLLSSRVHLLNKSRLLLGRMVRPMLLNEFRNPVLSVSFRSTRISYLVCSLLLAFVPKARAIVSQEPLLQALNDDFKKGLTDLAPSESNTSVCMASGGCPHGTDRNT